MRRSPLRRKTPLQRKCEAANCRNRFTPARVGQVACSPRCALAVAGQRKAKRERREHRAARERIKTRSQWLREAQSAFNAFIRARDEALPCISCEKSATWGGQWHASHYRPAGRNSELRFDESNVHKACSECNNFKSGNLVEYRLGLIERAGLAEVERLERTYAPRRWTIEELQEIKSTYRRKTSQLEKQRRAA